MITLALLSPLLFLALLMVLQRVEESVFPPRRTPAGASDSRPPDRAFPSRTAAADGGRRSSTGAGGAGSRRAAAAANVTS